MYKNKEYNIKPLRLKASFACFWWDYCKLIWMQLACIRGCKKFHSNFMPSENLFCSRGLFDWCLGCNRHNKIMSILSKCLHVYATTICSKVDRISHVLKPLHTKVSVLLHSHRHQPFTFCDDKKFLSLETTISRRKIIWKWEFYISSFSFQ